MLCRTLAAGACPPGNELADGLALGGEFHLILCHHIAFCHGAVVKIKGDVYKRQVPRGWLCPMTAMAIPLKPYPVVMPDM